MKKLAAISLLVLFSFNWFGYRLMIDIMENKASLALQARLDKFQYDESGLLEIRLPLSLPYSANGLSAFEQYEGETEINGVHYRYVKRKLVNDTLVLLCIPNHSKNELLSAKSDLFELSNDLQKPGTNSNKEVAAKTFFSDYLVNDLVSEYQSTLQSAGYNRAYIIGLGQGFCLTKDRPPQS